MFKRSQRRACARHFTASPHGVGTMGRTACEFIDFLADAHQTYWQVLPLGHTGFGDSPYQCFSAAAGNPYLIDMDLLVEYGLLTADEVRPAISTPSPDVADFEQLADTRWPLFRKAYSRVTPEMKAAIADFTEENREWLPDYALFMALKEEKYHHAPVYMWPEEDVCDRKPEALARVTEELRGEIDFRIFLQYIFFKQWNALRAHAKERASRSSGISQSMFPQTPRMCGRTRRCSSSSMTSAPSSSRACRPTTIPRPVSSGATRSTTGRRTKKTGYAWWIWRMKSNMALFDVVRLDHFRGFRGLLGGRRGRGHRHQRQVAQRPGHGAVPRHREGARPHSAHRRGSGRADRRGARAVRASGFPGMRVLIFGFTPDYDNEHLPHNYLPNSIVYTSTHDSQTVCEQIMDICSEPEKQFAYRYLRTSHAEAMGWSAIKCVWASPAHIAMTTLQGLLSLGADARMNTPATIGGKTGAGACVQRRSTRP